MQGNLDSTQAAEARPLPEVQEPVLGPRQTTEVERVCLMCKTSKAIELFGRHVKMRGGRNTRCLDCTRMTDRVRAGTVSRKASNNARNKAYYRTDKGQKTAKRAKAKSVSAPGARKLLAEKARASYRNGHPWKCGAMVAVNKAIKSGLLPLARDVKCGVGVDCYGRNHWHHDSYRREDWANVRCLCSRHHQLWHRDNIAIPFGDSGDSK